MSTFDLSGTDATASASGGLNRNHLMAAFWAAVGLSVLLPRIPHGRKLLYPFALLGVWIHELGHAVASELTGGDVARMELYKGLGGVVWHSGAGRFTGAFVSAAGLLGPAFFGALIIIFSARPKTSRYVLPVISVVAVLSVILFIRNAFGIWSMSLIAAVLIPIAFKAPDIVRVFVAQLIGIQFCLASWGTWDYLFTDSITIDGGPAPSDTGSIADALFLPYWFWGILIAALSAAMLVWAFYVAWIKPFRGDGANSGSLT